MNTTLTDRIKKLTAYSTKQNNKISSSMRFKGTEKQGKVLQGKMADVLATQLMLLHSMRELKRFFSNTSAALSASDQEGIGLDGGHVALKKLIQERFVVFAEYEQMLEQLQLEISGDSIVAALYAKPLERLVPAEAIKEMGYMVAAAAGYKPFKLELIIHMLDEAGESEAI
ncbi:hypothetical protein [Paenibacillus sp. BIHB 4019]|nr:hypothetical protein [Paenibacillus sp. BIHB 4019]